MIEYNEYNSSIEELDLNNNPQEIIDAYHDFTNNIPYVKNLISKDRKRAKDLPRDSEGKIIINLEEPHILEDMSYFTQTRDYFKEHGYYTALRPNNNPNSEFGKFIKRELTRCFEGMVRPSDGEWITGDYYFYLNYCKIELTKEDKYGKTIRVGDFPAVWEGQYYLSHYINKARNNGKHCAMLASRGRGKSFFGASMLAKRFILGESQEVNKKVTCVVTASERKFLEGAYQILNMFQSYIDFNAENTQFPSKRLTSSINNMQWQMGFIDKETGIRKGSENKVIGITSHDDSSKLRGSRGQLYIIEEFGTFPRLLEMYNVLLPSVSDGNSVWGTILMYGTSGDNDSDFSGAKEIMYNPIGYNILPINNVYDKDGQGSKNFTYFFPAYINRSNCYDENGNSNVTKAILELLKTRYEKKYNSTDINTVTKFIAENPITPQEAILKVGTNMFPVTELTERLNQLDSSLNTYDDVYIGRLELNKGKIEFKPSNDNPIRVFPTKDNKVEGAIEIFQMPKEDLEGNIFSDRYIIGHDPVDDDVSSSLSLTSTFVLDLWTDNIVAEWTGRFRMADENFEIVRRLALFYNAKVLYENNKKGLFAYFSRMNSLYLLADCPEHVRDKDLVKGEMIGNKQKGVNATKGINNYADMLICKWLITSFTTTETDNEGKEVEVTLHNLYKLKNRALIEELIKYNPVGNFDRIRALGMAMIYREEKMVQYQGDFKSIQSNSKKVNEDGFFNRYDNMVRRKQFVNKLY